MVLNRRLELPMSERQAALRGPRDMKPTGSPGWCWQGLHMLRLHWSKIETEHERFDAELADLVAVKAWEKIPPEHPYGSLDAMLKAEIGKPEAVVRNRVRELRAHGGDRRSAGFQGNNGTLKPDRRGNTSVYTDARLRRDRPDLAARVDAGELSPNAAAIEAGFRVRTATVPLTVEGVYRAALKLSPADQDEVLRLLAERARG